MKPSTIDLILGLALGMASVRGGGRRRAAATDEPGDEDREAGDPPARDDRGDEDREAGDPPAWDDRGDDDEEAPGPVAPAERPARGHRLREARSFAEAQRTLLSDAYLHASAAEKRAALWRAVLSCRYEVLPEIRFSYLWSVLRGAYILVLRRPFVTVADVRPSRSKLFHPWGTAVKVRFVADGDHPYTGIFETGALGLVRLSLAMDVRRYSPGGAFKFLVDGRPSRNVVLVPGLDPFDHHDFFAPALTNVLEKPTRPPFSFGWFLTYFWMSHVAHPVIQPLGHLSRVTSDGRTVSRPKAPHQIHLRAAEGLGFHPETREDFRDEMARIEPGTVLYRVYALDSEGDREEVYVGHIVSESRFVASSFVDRALAFEHAREPVARFERRLLLLGFALLILALVVLAVVFQPWT